MDGNQIFDPDDAGLTNEETATILGVKPETLATWRSQGAVRSFAKLVAASSTHRSL
jgi:hypothetical protein